MNNFFIDIIPVFLFFIVFKYYGIYAATWTGIIATFLQVSFYRLWHKRWDKMQLATLIIFSVFGGMTLYFHDPIFVKWKPTILFWIFSIVLLGSHLIGKKTLAQQVLEGAMKRQNPSAVTAIVIPSSVGKQLNIAWTLFFILLGSVNLYIAYTFDDQVWVNFKLYGITGATLCFSILQMIFLHTKIKWTSS